MKGQELKIVFKEDLAFLAKEVALDFDQVKISDFVVKLKGPACWTIRVINYIENEHKLFVEVLSYQTGNAEFSSNQIELADRLILIKEVVFRNIETTGLLNTVKLLHPKTETVYRREITQFQTNIKREPIKETFKEPFSIPIKDVKFLSGKVVFEKKLQQFKGFIKFEILNENLIEEYDV